MAPRFIDDQLERDKIINGLESSIHPQPFCQVCGGIMTSKSYTGIRVTYFEYKK